MNKYIETKIREAARKFACNKKTPSQPETQFRKGAEWMYELLTDGQTASAYREQLCQDVKNREGKTEVDAWKLSLINELADMLAERDAMMVTIREEGRLVTKWDKAGNMYKESNPLYVHVKAKEQSISVWRDKLGLSNTVNPDRIKQDAKAGSERETDPLYKFTDTIMGKGL
jgi:hypothetical protein